MLFRRTWPACLLTAFALVAAPLRAADEPKAEIAHLKLSGDMEESPGNPEPLFGGGGENFRTKLDRIKKARKDANVKALYLEIDGVAVGWGKLDELSRALDDCKKAGKKIFAYVESGSVKDYLVALSADEICCPESGWLMLTGMRLEMSFYKDLFEKIGVQADFLMMGDFKGAAEPFIRSNLSEPNRKQLTSMLNDHFDHDLVGRIVKGRPAKKFSAEDVNKLIDQGPYTARAALKAGLVDRIAYESAFQDEIKKGVDGKDVKLVKNYAQKKADKLDLGDPFAVFKLFAAPKSSGGGKGPKVAVIYAVGVITTGKSSVSMLGGESCGSTTMLEAIRQAESDDTVKAIVLRVDSPGGSALASDLIWNELRKCKKPVVASMSDVAASGGYYISMAASKIYAEPGTLTGSIGVVGGKFALGGLFDKVGVKTDVISRGANAGMFSTNTPFSPSEREAFRTMMKDIYDQFLDKALQGREKAGQKLSRTELEKLAGGRIWTGRQALENHLVDKLGTLDDAVAAAKKMAGLPEDKEADLLLLPKSKGFLDNLLDSYGDSRVQTDVSKLPVLREFPEVTRKLRSVEAMLQLRREPVQLLLPFHIEVK
jgi:protease-4